MSTFTLLAGGIDQVMLESIRGFRYAESATILPAVIVAMSIIDPISQYLRKRMI